MTMKQKKQTYAFVVLYIAAKLISDQWVQRGHKNTY